MGPLILRELIFIPSSVSVFYHERLMFLKCFAASIEVIIYSFLFCAVLHSSVFIRAISVSVLSLSHLAISVILTSCNEFGKVHSFSVFLWGVSGTLVFIIFKTLGRILQWSFMCFLQVIGVFRFFNSSKVTLGRWLLRNHI